MKTVKILSILQTVLMTLSAAFTTLYFFLSASDAAIPLFVTGAAFFLTAVAVAAVNAVYSLFRWIGRLRASQPPEDPTKTVLLFKILQVPLYIANFVCWAILLGAFMNPFMMIAAPLIAAAGSFLTYVLLLGTSVPNILFAIRLLGGGSKKGALIAALILHFLFVLDLPGAIILYAAAKKTPAERL